MRAWSYQSVGRGADGIMFFQWRQAIAGAEKFHAGMLPHGGTDTRVFREVEELGAELGELSKVSGLLGARVKAPTAIVLDWDSWWAVEQPASPTAVSYLAGVFSWYRALAACGATVDFVRPSADLNGYRLVVVPSLFVASDEQLSALDAYTSGGGTLVVGFLTAIVDQQLHARAGGYLGALRETLGLWIEEFAPPAAPDLAAAGGGAPPALAVRGDVIGGQGAASLWGEYVRIESATVDVTFDGGALDGHPAVTHQERGSGTAWYVATQLDDTTLAALLDTVLSAAAVDRSPVVAGVEFVRRGAFLVAINHSDATVTLVSVGTDLLTGGAAAGLTLAPQGVAIVSEA
jgi:beta-galactosidase